MGAPLRLLALPALVASDEDDSERRLKPLRYAIEPHSTSFDSSQGRETGFVRKSLQPAASAATRSACSEEAVRATMITGMLRRGEFGVPSGLLLELDAGEPISEVGVVTSMLTLFCRSISRISLVASIPLFTGSWISICARPDDALARRNALRLVRRKAYQDEVEIALLPHIDRLLAVLRDLIGNSFLPHEHGQNSLIDRVV